MTSLNDGKRTNPPRHMKRKTGPTHRLVVRARLRSAGMVILAIGAAGMTLQGALQIVHHRAHALHLTL
jgi:hypothetical protein